jgi:hypothetical protein
VDLKRQPVADGTFLEIKAWGAWNGKWVPYVYEPITVRGAAPGDLNAIMARYREMKPDAGLEVWKGLDSAFRLRSERGRSRFQLQTPGSRPRLSTDNPEGRIELGLSDGTLTVNGSVVEGRVVSVHVTPGRPGIGSAESHGPLRASYVLGSAGEQMAVQPNGAPLGTEGMGHGNDAADR